MPAIFEYVRNLSESMLPPKVPHWTAWPGLRPASLNFRVSPEAISASAKWRGITSQRVLPRRKPSNQEPYLLAALPRCLGCLMAYVTVDRTLERILLPILRVFTTPPESATSGAMPQV